MSRKSGTASVALRKELIVKHKGGVPALAGTPFYWNLLA
jgi:hypothetical protein